LRVGLLGSKKVWIAVGIAGTKGIGRTWLLGSNTSLLNGQLAVVAVRVPWASGKGSSWTRIGTGGPDGLLSSKKVRVAIGISRTECVGGSWLRSRLLGCSLVSGQQVKITVGVSRTQSLERLALLGRRCSTAMLDGQGHLKTSYLSKQQGAFLKLVFEPR
jgi:hypothetical protein